MSTHTVQALEKKLEEKKQDLSSKQVEIAEVNEENEKLRARIAAQEINLADVDKMSKEKSKIKEILRGVLAQREGLDKTVWDSEVQLSKKLEELEATLRTYHTTGDRYEGDDAVVLSPGSQCCSKKTSDNYVPTVIGLACKEIYEAMSSHCRLVMGAKRTGTQVAACGGTLIGNLPPAASKYRK